MGRAKLKMDLISNKKARTLAFKKRKQSLEKKLHELTTLCEVDACMIIYDPDQSNGCDQPETWENKPDGTRRLIALYKAKNKEHSRNNTYTLFDFFNERNKKIEGELSRARKKMMEAKYPTWVESLDGLKEGQLRDFSCELRCKSEIVKSRIESLRRNEQGLMHMISQSRAFDSQQEYYDNHLMLMDVNDYGSGNVFYDSMVGPGLTEPVMCNVPGPVSAYCGPDGGGDNMWFYDSMGNVPGPVSAYYGPDGGGDNKGFYVGPGLAEPVIGNVPRPISGYYGPDVVGPVVQQPYVGAVEPECGSSGGGGGSLADAFQYYLMTMNKGRGFDF